MARAAETPERLAERDDARADITFSELGPGRGDAPSRMLRQGPWKLYKYHDDTPPVLFNLEEDPGELEDRSADPGCAAVRAALLQRLYEDWEPPQVERRSAALARDMQTLAAWGQRVQPAHPDTLPVPDVEDVVRC